MTTPVPAPVLRATVLTATGAAPADFDRTKNRLTSSLVGPAFAIHFRPPISNPGKITTPPPSAFDTTKGHFVAGPLTPSRLVHMRLPVATLGTVGGSTVTTVSPTTTATAVPTPTTGLLWPRRFKRS